MIEELLKRHPLVSDQVSKTEVKIILENLQHVLEAQVAGAVVEFGCYIGTTALFEQRLLQSYARDNGQVARELHVYDSFAGLPPKSVADASPVGEQFKAGELRASKAQFIKHFVQTGLPLPVIHKGWFSDFVPTEVPEPIALAFLDGDFYDSIWQSLELVWPKLSAGARVIVDDYQAEALPGAHKAVDDWLAQHPGKLTVTSSLAIITHDS